MKTPSVSFEFFPPKSLQASFRLWDCVQTLAPYSPEFVSVTYGAGGTTRQLTHDVVDAITTSTDLSVAAHLTCVDATRKETLAIANEYKAAGVSHIVALRGDPPKGCGTFSPAQYGFSGSIDLTRALALEGFDVTVGAYPEPHPDAIDRTSSIDHLKAKFDAGATRAITQFFFDPEVFLRFRDECAAAGITAPILPGVLPIENWKGARGFADQCGVSVPKVLSDAFDRVDTPEQVNLLAIAQATELCDDLLSEGVDHLHFYTLNTPDLSRDICRALGMTPHARLEKVA